MPPIQQPEPQPAGVEEAVAALGRGLEDTARLKKAVGLLTKVLGNARRSPEEPKFRALKLANKTVAEQLLPCPGARALLAVVGFKERVGVLELPAGADPALLDRALAALAEVPRRFLFWLPAGSPEAAAAALPLGSTADGGVLNAGRSAAVGGGMQLGAARAGGGGLDIAYAGKVATVTCGGGAAHTQGAATTFVAGERVSDEAFAMGTPFGGGYRPPPAPAEPTAPPSAGGRRNYIAERLDAELAAELGAGAGGPVSDEAYAMGNPFGGGYRPSAAPAAAIAPAALVAAGAVGVAGDYEVLCCAGGAAAAIALVPAAGGAVPPGALPCGWEADGAPLYLAACPVDGGARVVPGKVREGFDGASYAEGGAERVAAQYAVVCLAPAGRVEHLPSSPSPPRRRFLVSVDELLRWGPRGLPGAALDLAQSTPLPPPAGDADAPRVLHCHDMAGGYNARADVDYLAAFGGWASIDEFAYFGHHRVSIPPRAWVDACHANGVRCYGTLLTEHAQGARENTALLDGAAAVSAQLAAMLEHYGFDGWFVNIEAPLQGARDHARLAAFLRQLRAACRRSCATARVLVYDSVTPAGAVAYQNELNAANQALFDACDGLFLNYWWRPSQLVASAARAAGRRCQVYAGVDVFARGAVCHKPGPGCAVAVGHAAAAGLSLGLFAPGWTLEMGEGRGGGASAAGADARFWSGLDLDRVRKGADA